MSGLALGLVLLSAVTHAGWNLLAKRGMNQEVFIWLAQVGISVFLFPLGLFLLIRYPIDATGWIFTAGTVLLHIFYFLFLGRGYARADLSVVYPIARGMGPAVVPVLGVLVLGESVSPPAVAGIATVVVGIYTVYWWGSFRLILSDPLKLFKEPGTRYALLTGATIATYSVWDKVGVSHVTPFLYMYLMSLGSALGLAPFLIRSHGTAALRAEWRYNATSIVAVGVMTFVAYGLILTAFQFSRVSYISPAREVGIVIGVLLGVLVLKEPFGRGRIIGSGMIAAGLVLIAVAP